MGTDPYGTQGLTPVVPFTRWVEKVPPPPGRADALLLCSVSPYPPRIRPPGPWVPAEPLSSFYKGRMTLAKAELLVGDFLARNVNIYFHPTRWFDLRRRRKGFVCSCGGEPRRFQPLRAQYLLRAPSHLPGGRTRSLSQRPMGTRAVVLHSEAKRTASVTD